MCHLHEAALFGCSKRFDADPGISVMFYVPLNFGSKWHEDAFKLSEAIDIYWYHSMHIPIGYS